MTLYRVLLDGETIAENFIAREDARDWYRSAVPVRCWDSIEIEAYDA